MKVLVSLAAVAILFLFGMLGAVHVVPEVVFGAIIPYMALAVLFGGLVYRVVGWAKIPVPFRIPTVCGQQKSLPWIKQAKLDSPSGMLGVLGRMALEVGLFRSLLRNTKTKLLAGGKLVYATSLWLWIGAIAFHWSLLVILLRHLRLFTNPAPWLVTFVGELDGFLEVGLPVFYVTSAVFLAALTYLLLRRLASPQLRYISLAEDYFLLFLLLGIGLSGFWLRHIGRTDIEGVKELAAGLASFRPALPTTIGPLFFGHLFLVCVLMAYIPFSKVMHLAGVLLSPTRNLANNNRMKRHVNPWNYPVKVHTYEEYEDELRDKMKGAGLPVDKQ
jgi:nitrate reductase gamma subunit